MVGTLTRAPRGLMVAAVFLVGLIAAIVWLGQPASAQAEDPIWTLRNEVHNGYLRQEDGSINVAMSSTLDVRAQWRATSTANGIVFQNMATGRYLDADGSSNGGDVNTSSSIAADDYWTVTEAGNDRVNVRNVATGGWIDGDGNGQNIDTSSSVSSDDFWIRAIVNAPTPTPTTTPTPTPTPEPNDPQTPFNGPHTIPGVVQAEDFDEGGPNVSFFDTTASNIGGAYRSTAVDIFPTSGGNGFTVGHTRAGEWLEYTVESASLQSLEVTARVATGAAAPGSLRLDVNGSIVAVVPVTSTGGWWTFANPSFGNVVFPPGSSIVRVTWVPNGAQDTKINLDRLNFGEQEVVGPVCAGLVQEVEAGLLSGSMVEIADAAASGGAAVQAAPGSGGRPGISEDFAELCVTVPVAGDYRLDANVLAPNSADDSFYVSIDDGPVALWDMKRDAGWVLDSVADRNGADPVIYSLTAGDHSVRIYQREDGASIDAIELVSTSAQAAVCGPLTQEAEGGVVAGTVVTVNDAAASGGVAVQADPGTGGRTFPSESYLELCFTVPAGGNYRIDASILAPSPLDDSFYVTVDGGSAALWDMAQSAGWQTDSVSNRGGDNPVLYGLSAGDHVVRLYQREDGPSVDTVSLVSVGGPTPTPTATSTPTPTPTPTPGPSPEGPFTLHSNANYGGNSQEFDSGVFSGSAALSFVGNDAASSLQIDAGYLALVCTNSNGSGSCRGFTNPKPNLGVFGLDNQISYVQVQLVGGPFLLTPGSDVDQIVNALPEGTTFTIAPGLHSGHQIVPKADQIFNCQPGAILDGNGVNGVAFSSARGNAHNIEIRGCEIRNYDQGPYVGAINGRDTSNFNIQGLNWLVEDNFIHNNEGPGVNLANGMIVQNNEISDNAQIGVSGIGSSSRYLENFQVLGNNIHDNNYGPIYAQGNPYHEGGFKVTWSRNGVVSGNDVHHNKGFGIHFDLSSHDIMVENNQIRNITDSRQWATYLYIEEDSYNITARFNVVTTPPQSANWDIRLGSLKGIVTAGSDSNIVEFNTITGGNGDGGSWQPLGINYYSGDNNNDNIFRGNTVNLTFGNGYVGVTSSQPTGTQFIDNTYTGGLGLTALGSSVGWNAWRNNYGFDVNGSYS